MDNSSSSRRFGSMMYGFPRRRGHLFASAFGALMLSLLLVLPVQACTIDGVATMTLNNLYAAKTKGTPTSATLASWAPFALGDASPRATLHFGEDVNKLRKVLSAASLSHPFTWRFGDGAAAVGRTVSHAYTQAGVYKVEARYYLPRTKQWVLFDSARLQVVAPVVVSLVAAPSSHGASGTNYLVIGGGVLAALACLAVIGVQMRNMHAGGEITGES